MADTKRDAVALISDIVLAVIPGVTPMPVIWRWVTWFVCFVVFVFVVQSLIGLRYKLKPLAVLLLSCIFALVFWTTAYGQWRAEKASEGRGELVSAGLLPDVPAGQYVIEIGPNSQGRLLFGITNHEPWVMGRDRLRFDSDNNGQMLFSTTIRDRTGNTIVEIDKNVWRVSKQENESWDKNYSKNRLEVLDGRGLVVLQVKLFSNGVQLQGVWHQDNGDGFVFVQLKPGEVGSMWGLFSAANPQMFPDIYKAFKYPSAEHWGEEIY